ncbi:MAG TPA: IclR family transcriptional regulator [Candidatus Methylomirabilis sp.]|nr:IclR family transcriptional regulator [Candidatus Methylomirabilis sp.]HSC70007.1 IclR family transcriptional regulator [Candidatus Methylomirabilis sp.]
MANRALRRDGKTTAQGPLIQSLQRGLGILEIIAKKGKGISMAEVSREIGLHTSTTFHLLRTLSTLGYLVQDESTREYLLGSKVFHLAASAWTEVQLSKIAKPLLAEMAQQTGETSHLAVLERGEVIVIDKIDGSGPVRLSDRVGYPRPAHCTAIGKALLAYLPAAELRSFLKTAEFRPFTPKTITAAPILEGELERVRKQGYSFDDEEFAQGIRCLAAPARNFTGHVVAAIGISGPVWRVSLDRMAHLTQFVRGMGHRLSQLLGHSGETEDNGDHPPRN